MPEDAKLVRAGEGPVWWVVGNQVTFKAVAEDTAGTYTLFEITVPPGEGTPPHIHSREDEGFYILEGELQMRLGNEERTLAAGDYLHAPRGMVHCYRTVSKQPVKMLVSAVPAGIEKYFEEVAHRVTDSSPAPEAATPEDFARLLEAAPKYGLTILAE